MYCASCIFAMSAKNKVRGGGAGGGVKALVDMPFQNTFILHARPRYPVL